MNMLRRLHDEEDGQMAVLALGTLIFLVVMVAAALFLGAHATQKRQLQNIADSAALGGAQELDGTAASDGPAIAKAQEYLDAHAPDLDGAADIIVGDNHTSVRVTVRRTPDLSFPTFGLGDTQITARAKAQIASPYLPGPGVVPLSISEEAYDNCVDNGVCDDVVLKEYAGNNTPPQSSYQLLDLGLTVDGDGGAAAVCEFLIGGSTNPIEDPTESKPGNVSSLHNCLIQRMEAAAATGGTHPPACFDWEDVQDNGELRDECNPLSGAQRGADSDFPNAQPTTVILIPVLVNFCQGSCDLDIIGDGEDPRLFAFFWIDPVTVYGSPPTCAPPGGGGGGGGGGGPGGGAGQCEITGRFILEYEAFLTPNTGGNGEFDPDSSLIKVIELVE